MKDIIGKIQEKIKAIFSDKRNIIIACMAAGVIVLATVVILLCLFSGKNQAEEIEEAAEIEEAVEELEEIEEEEILEETVEVEEEEIFEETVEVEEEEIFEETVEVKEEDVETDEDTETEAETAELEGDSEDEEVIEEIVVTEYLATMYANTSANVRAGNSTDYDILGTVALNEEITIVGKCDNGWYQIDYNGILAYISGKVLSEEQTEVAAASSSSATSSSEASSSESWPYEFYKIYYDDLGFPYFYFTRYDKLFGGYPDGDDGWVELRKVLNSFNENKLSSLEEEYEGCLLSCDIVQYKIGVYDDVRVFVNYVCYAVDGELITPEPWERGIDIIGNGLGTEGDWYVSEYSPTL